MRLDEHTPVHTALKEALSLGNTKRGHLKHKWLKTVMDELRTG